MSALAPLLLLGPLPGSWRSTPTGYQVGEIDVRLVHPAEPGDWVAALGLSPVSAEETATELGWPATWMELEDGAAMIYRFVHLVAVAVARGPRDAVAALRPVLATGHPSFRSAEPVALSEIWNAS